MITPTPPIRPYRPPLVTGAGVVVAVTTAGLSAAAASYALASQAFLESDGITHYLYARASLRGQAYLLSDVWGRPFKTLLHALPAQLPGDVGGVPRGLIGVRIVSLACAVIAGVLAMRAARRLGVSAAVLVPMLLLAMPLAFLHAASELTELPFAVLLAAALYAYASRNLPLLAVAAGLSPAARPEGVGFLLLAGIVLVGHAIYRPDRRGALSGLILLPVPLVAWSIIGWIHHGHPGGVAGLVTWLPDHWPYSQESVYSPGHPLRFVTILPAVVGPGVFPLLLLGSIAFARRAGLRTHDGRGRLAVLLACWGLLAVHSVLHATGKLASSGEPRYLVAAAPAWAILTAAGFAGLRGRLGATATAGVAAVLAVTPIIVVQLAYPVLPYKSDTTSRAAVQAAEAFTASEHAGRSIYTSHPVVWMRLGLSPLQPTRDELAGRRSAAYLFDDIHSLHNADADRVVTEHALNHAGWHPAEVATPDGWSLWLSPP